jgi:hypothetical protein
MEFGRNTQRAICLLMSLVTVGTTLAFGAHEALALVHDGYSVTIVQLQ